MLLRCVTLSTYEKYECGSFGMKHQQRFAMITLLWAILTASAGAQNERRTTVALAEGRLAQGFSVADSAGLFVGIRQFDERNSFHEVAFAVDDAVDLAWMFAVELELINPKKVVLCLAGEPQSAEARQRLAELKKRGAELGGTGRNAIIRALRDVPRHTGRDGLMVVSMASHGFSQPGGDYVLAADSVSGVIAETGLELQRVLSMVGEAPALRRLVLIDACREKVARGGGGEAAAMAASFAHAVDEARGMAVLLGASAGGFAYDDFERQNGVFTSAVIDGLEGGASADARGFVTIDLLAKYVQRKVQAWVRRHRPQHVEKSRGIKSVIDGDVAQLPLTIDPTRVGAMLDFVARREEALERLKVNQAPGGAISGAMYDQVAGLLMASQVPTKFALEVLDELERLGGEEHSRRAFAWFVGQHAAHFGRTSPQQPPMIDSKESRTALESGGPAVKVLAAGELWVDPKFGMRFRQIPAGTFQMGSPEGEAGRDSDETQHAVRLTRSFLLGETEVTQGQWQGLTGTAPSHFSACGADCPVEKVSWWEALAFANQMSSESGLSSCYMLSGCTGTLGGGCSDASEFWCGDYSCKAVELVPGCDGYRLPTEAEWEYAVRAGSTSAIYTGELTLKGRNNGPELNPIAWYGGNSGVGYSGGLDCSAWPEKQKSAERCGPHPVAKKKANAWNLRDMLGNVWEWNWDWDGDYAVSSAVDPLGAETGARRVLRGCSWGYGASGCRAADRNRGAPGYRINNVGFRLARTYP